MSELSEDDLIKQVQPSNEKNRQLPLGVLKSDRAGRLRLHKAERLVKDNDGSSVEASGELRVLG